ncbi:exopolyphosphatase [Neisseria gonorrhoeae]|uniref:Exopolyphosphatase n=1 Tax=Neisseria gonorrhoeae TaxID=485 RepID=A0A378VV99_NEIGO|nr:exopolyphosphatase [Neisseria gonorrhoeae]
MGGIIGGNEMLWYAVLSLRLAALFCRSRQDLSFPKICSCVRIRKAAASSCVLTVNGWNATP